MYVSVREALEGRGYKYEFNYGEWGWEWDMTEVYTKDGRVFSLNSSGCSCNSFDDSWDTVDEAIGDMKERTCVPTLEEATPKSWASWDLSGEALREKFRELGLR